MMECPCKLLHMDKVGPAHVRSTGGKWYVLALREKLTLVMGIDCLS
jgi:hypothetical protein